MGVSWQEREVHGQTEGSIITISQCTHLAGLAQGGLDAVTCRLAGQGGCAGGISRLAAVANQ